MTKTILIEFHSNQWLLNFIAALLLLPPNVAMANESAVTTTTVARSQIKDVSDSTLVEPVDVICDQDLLLKCSTFDVREVTISNENIAKATVTVGNLRYILVTGMAEGTVSLTVWPKDSITFEPIQIKVRVIPDTGQFTLLVERIATELHIAIRIEPIPTSRKILITGDVGSRANVDRVMDFIVGTTIPRERIVNNLTPQHQPCCIAIPCCRSHVRRCR